MMETNAERFRDRQRAIRRAGEFYRKRALEAQAEDRVMPVEQATLVEYADELIQEEAETPEAIAREACTINIKVRLDPHKSAARAAYELKSAAADLLRIAGDIDAGRWTTRDPDLILPPEQFVTLGKDD